MVFRPDKMVDAATRSAAREGVRFSVRPGRAFLIPIGGVLGAVVGANTPKGAEIVRYIVHLFEQADIFDPW